MSLLTKTYFEFYFFDSLEQLIISLASAIDIATTLNDHVLANSFHRFSQLGVKCISLSLNILDFLPLFLKSLPKLV